MPAIAVRFFGRFEPFCAEKAFDLDRSYKAKAILQYLLARRRRPMLQDSLIAWLEPAPNYKRVSRSLNSSIYDLRKLIRSRLSSVISSDCILLKENFSIVDLSVEVWTDKDELESPRDRGEYLVRRAENRRA